ncbi:uncharacterized protein LOC114269441 isoform X2 [Camellia sinensis]|uniref:uncharacterized protein LOC114269441 isoform X2 n=1 Tax=Camellia sinensis TaxID=4442 RepID=UPI0010368EFD|nr:uncharacterized protein LOC114269441 isoform X2 [Camellia sinensis]
MVEDRALLGFPPCPTATELSTSRCPALALSKSRRATSLSGPSMALLYAIVNPANQRMLGGAGTDGAIHRAAGKELRAACYDVEEVERGIRCPTGEARITQGFNLPASHVIHTVGPIYDVDPNPEASLRSAYSLRVAKQNNIQYIAYTAISCGNHRYPLDEAATIAISTVRELANDFKEVHFVHLTDEAYNVWLDKANELLHDQ